MNPEAPHRLPAWARRMLERVLPPGVAGASILGDLAEEYSELRAGPGRAVWLAVEVARLTFHYARLATGGGGTLRFAVRRIRRDPVFGGLAVATMALGLGATVTLFSVVKAVLLDPLPYDDPDALVALFEAHPPRDISRNVANPGNVAGWARASTLAGVEAVVLQQPRIVTDGGEPREVMTSIVTPGYLELLGVAPDLGRGFTADAGAADGSQVVLAHRGWMELFGGDPGAVGETLVINGTAAEVVGVLPPVSLPFVGGSGLLVAMPLSAMGDQTSTGRFLNVVARLAPGAGVDAARRELDGIQSGLRDAHPDFNAGWDVTVEGIRGVLLGEVRSPLWTLLAAVVVLLLVACVNVANLTLARATERRSELAVRTALGASRGVLARQLLLESLVLAGFGGAVGLALAWGALEVMAPGLMEAFTIPRLGSVGIDPGVLAFALAATGGTGLLFGVVPALSAGGWGAAATLAAEGRGPSRSTGRIRSALVVAEVALSVVLLTSAALLVRSFASVAGVETGFEPARVVTARVSLTGPAYQGTEPDLRFFAALEPRLAAIPGVEAAGGVAFLPLDGMGSATSYVPADRPEPPREAWPVADVRPVLGDYFGAMGIELIAGRTFGPDDDAGAPRAVVVSRALAEESWPGQDPVGRPLAVHWDDLDPWTVVGVVEDVVHEGMADDPRAMIYLPVRQAPWFSFMTLAVRSRGDAGSTIRALRDAVAEVDPAVPLTRVQTMDDLVRTATARPRMTAFLLTLFAGSAALLAAVGLYGVLAYTVARRVREIGVRMALGAEGGDVVAMVTGEGLRMVALGGVLGLAGAAAGARLLEPLLYRVSPWDPWAFAAAAALFGAVGLAASVLPALRAVRVPPGRALREG